MSTARQAGLGVVISSALDTSVGVYQAGLIQAHLEATTEDWKDAGLGTMSFLAHDVVHAPHLARSGLLTLAEPVLDQGALESHQASPERTQWWHERLRRCFALLES
jgi:O-succinylbenzoate synthase